MQQVHGSKGENHREVPQDGDTRRSLGVRELRLVIEVVDARVDGGIAVQDVLVHCGEVGRTD